MTKRGGKNVLFANANPDRLFWTADGRTLRNYFDLCRALEEMSDDTYRHHARIDKNDFSTWVSDIFGDQRLAKRLAAANNREKSQIAVLKHMVSVLTKKGR